jgi:hypothetical protein
VGQNADVPPFFHENESFQELTKMPKIFRWMKKAAPHRNPLLQITDLVWHKLKINTYPSDYYRFQFYRKDKTWDEKGWYLGRMGSLYWPFDSIFLKDMALMTNKYIHKHFLMGLGLPTPELLASVGRHYGVCTLDQLKALWETWCFDIVVKPVSGARGSQVVVLAWDDGRFFDGEGDEWSIDRLWEHISQDMEGGSLIERRIFNVGNTEEIHPSSLNTFRVAMIRTEDCKWHVAKYFMRFGRGKSRIDNIHAGGIIIFLDEKGVATEAFTDNNTRRITHHPDTGRPLTGFVADGFDEVVALGFRASAALAVAGTMGWDIAYTNQGPMIIECNAVWGAKYQSVSGPVLSEEIVAGLKKRHAFSRYPRDRAFPGLQKISRWPWRRTRWWA